MGYKTNSYGLRLGINTSWRSKISTVRKESLSFIFIHAEISRYLDEFFNRRYFHRRGILFSHLMTKVKGSKKLKLHIYVFDPSPLLHAEQITECFRFKMLEDAYEHFVDKKEPASHVLLRDFAFAHFWNHVHKVFFKGRRKSYRRLERVIIRKLSKAFSYITIKARIFPIYKQVLNAEFFAKFLLMKFLYRRDVIQIVNPVAKRLLNRFNGYRIDCFGRFNRRQRASFYKFRKGPVPLNTFKARVDYHQVAFPLKYGACSIKVWLASRRPLAPIAGETQHFLFQGLDVHRLPKRQAIVSSVSADNTIRLRSSWTPLTKFKSPFGKTKVKRMIPVERYKIVHPFTQQFYSRRLNLLKNLLSRAGDSLSMQNRRFLVRLFLKPGKRAPSWFRSEVPLFRTPTRRELSEQVEKELAKVRKEAPKNREIFERKEAMKGRRRRFVLTGEVDEPPVNRLLYYSGKLSLSARLRQLRSQLSETQRTFLLTQLSEVRSSILAARKRSSTRKSRGRVLLKLLKRGNYIDVKKTKVKKGKKLSSKRKHVENFK